MTFTVFSGTFNPIHTAHLIIAESVRDALNLSEIIFIPAYIPPHRNTDLAAPHHRLKMIEIATKDNEFFYASDIEFRRHEKSYSYETVKQLRESRTTKNKINFIIGADAFTHIDSWHESEKLAELVNFIIVARPESESPQDIFNNIKLKNFTYNIVKAPSLDISSSYIRNKLKNGKSIKYLVTKEVESYIYKHKLFID